MRIAAGPSLVVARGGASVDCPICNTHIAEFKRRAREIEAAGIKEVIVFHSSPKSIRSYQQDVPFLMNFDVTRLARYMNAPGSNTVR